MSPTAYQLTAEDLERFETLEPSDVGRWYVLVRGCVQFCNDETHARELAQILRDDDKEQLKRDVERQLGVKFI